MTKRMIVSYGIASLFAAVLFVASITPADCAEIAGSPNSIPITWSSKVYVAKLPPPHGTTTLTIETSDDDKLRSITIKSDVGHVCIDDSMIDELTDLSEPQIAIPVDNARDATDHFVVLFEFGVPYKINYPDCKETGRNCVDWVQDIVSFDVDSAGNVVRRIYNVGELLGHKE